MKQKIRNISVDKKITFLIALLMFTRFLRVAPTTIADYPAEQYLLSYKYGFIARGLVGTLFMGIPHLSHNAIYLIGLCVEFVMTIVYLLLIYKGMRMVRDDRKLPVAIAVMIFSMSPMSPAYTYAFNNFGRFDTWLIMIVMIQCLLMLKPRIAKGMVVCALSLVAIMIHPVFVFTYFVVSELLLLYQSAVNSGKRAGWVVLLSVNTVVVCGMFLFFENVRIIGVGWTQDLMFHDMQARTDFDLGQNFYKYLNDWYFGTVDSQMANTVKPFSIQPGLLFATICFMLPYESIFLRTWWKGLKSCKKSKLFFFCMIFAFLAVIPAFVTQIDYGRWCAAYYLTQGLMFIWLLFISDHIVVMKVENIKIWTQQHMLIAVCLIIYCVTMGYFKDIATLELSEGVYYFFSNLFLLAKHVMIGG